MNFSVTTSIYKNYIVITVAARPVYFDIDHGRIKYYHGNFFFFEIMLVHHPITYGLCIPAFGGVILERTLDTLIDHRYNKMYLFAIKYSFCTMISLPKS